MKPTALFEKHRPKAWSEVIGHEKAIKSIRIAARNGFGGRAYVLLGKSGVGKTTIARLIGQEIADDCCIVEIDASRLDRATVEEIERGIMQRGIGKGGRVWIINEIHKLRGPMVTAMLTLLEPPGGLPEHVAFVLTTTFDGEETMVDGIDFRPLMGRCCVIRLSSQGWAQPAAEYAMNVARAEGLDGKPIAAYVRLINDCGGSLREALSRIDRGAMLD